MKKFKTASQLLDQCLSLRYFGPDTDGDGTTAILSHRVLGKGKLVVLVGENASGKSFMRRVVKGTCSKAEIECIHLSMEGRSDSFGGVRGFVYGDESYEATSVNSARTVTIGIRTCRDRTTPHVIMWDEPDLGLSENAAAGVGQLIREFTKTPPEHTLAAIVVTHSKALVSQLVDLEPHYLCFGRDPAPTLQDWINTPVKPRSIDELFETSRETHRRIAAILKSVRSS